MPVDYAEARVHYGDDSQLRVAFKRRSTASDGSAGDPQWFDRDTGAWDNEFDAAKHVRPLDRDPATPWEQSFAAPLKVTDDETAYAVVTLDSGKPVDIQASGMLNALTRRPSARP